MSENELPTGWTRIRLHDVVAVVRDRVDPKSLGALQFVGLEHIESATTRLYGTAPSSSVRSAATHFFDGDVLYGRLRPYLNKVHRARFEGLGSAELIPLTPATGIDPQFITYLLSNSVFVAFANRQTGGDRPRIDASEVLSYEFALPPTPEQHAIAAVLDDYFTQLDSAQETLIATLKRLQRFRASILNAAVCGRLVPMEARLAREEGRAYEPANVLLARILRERRRRSEDAELAKMTAAGRPPRDDAWKKRYAEPVATDISSLPELAEGWCWATVEMVGDVLLGRQRAPQYLLGVAPRPYLRVANVKDDRLDLSDVETMDFAGNHFEKYRLEPHDILVSEGQSPELVGQSAIYRGGIEGLCFQKTLHRFRAVLGGPSAEYAQLVFRSLVRQGVFRGVASITTNIAHLTLEKFKSAPFPLPPLAEQKRIEAESARLLSIADAAETEIKMQMDRIRALRQSILRWAFEGKLADQDPNEEPASELIARIRAERTARQPERRTKRAAQAAERPRSQRKRRGTPPR